MIKLATLSAVLVLALIGVGCGSKSAQNINNNPEVVKQEKQAEAIAKQCISKSKGKKALVNCLAPKGHAKELESCIASNTKDMLIHHTHILKDVSACVVKFR